MRPDTPLATQVAPSPNFGDRHGKAIDALILHYTGMPTGADALARLCDPLAKVSSHYLVWEDGRITQLVAECDRAWHAGVGVWAGDGDMNTVSVGIEIVNAGHDGGMPPYPTAQIDAVAALGRDICRRHSIPPMRVLGHSDLAPARKLDPGEWFPWARLAAAGVGIWIDAPPPDLQAAVAPGVTNQTVWNVQQKLSEIGYGCPINGTLDAATASVLVAFQRRFRPARVDGVLDASTIEALTILWDIIPQNAWT